MDVLENSSFRFADDGQRRLVQLVLMELSEARGWWSLKTHPCQELGVVFLSGRANKHSPREIILPIPSSTSLSCRQIQKYLASVRLEDCQTTGFILALCDSDSTTAYYKVTDGLVQPDPPEMSDWKKHMRHEQHQASWRHVCQQTQVYARQANTEAANQGEESTDTG